jgi:hypothetical protein
MNTLHTFGCSFTEEFKEFMNPPLNMMNGRVEYVVDYFGGIPPDGWPTMLSNKLGYNLKNYAGCNTKEGNCNFAAFNNICNNLDNFQKDDIVIVEWTMMERFRYVDDQVNSMRSILPNLYMDYMSKETMENMLVNRTHELWIVELFKHQKIINKLCELIGMKLFYWTIDERIVKYKLKDNTNNGDYLILDQIQSCKSYVDYIVSLGGKTITKETNNKINDGHFGLSGHQVIVNLFYDDIIKKIK